MKITVSDLPANIQVCVADTEQKYGYNPFDLHTYERKPVILACVRCFKQFNITWEGAIHATGKCTACRGQSRVKNRKPGGWHAMAPEHRERVQSEHRRCWRCGKYLDFGDDRYCAEHQALRDRAIKLRREFVVVAV